MIHDKFPDIHLESQFFFISLPSVRVEFRITSIHKLLKLKMPMG